MMQVYVESIFDCPAERVWTEVQTSRLLLEIIRPLLRFIPVGGEQFPERWVEAGTVVGRAFAFGVLPLGRHALYFERIDHVRLEIQTRESDRWIRRWDHLISVRELSGGRTLYSDRIDIDAGRLTPLVWLYARSFYRHRQRRWRRIARRLAAG
jgi:hypothetical protein